MLDVRTLSSLALVLCCSAGCLAQEVDPAASREIPPYVLPPARAGVPTQRFIVFGDWGTGSRDQRDTAAAMVRRVKAERVPAGQRPLDFMVTTGDNFYPDGVSSADDPQWQTKFERIYADPALQVPFYPSLGNHDHRGDPQAQIDYGRKNPSWVFPSRFHTFTVPLGDAASIQFFVLDTTPLGYRSLDAEQIDWLERELAASRATWKVAVGHHPLYSHSKRGYNLTLIRRLEPLFAAHHVDVYMAGHDHTLELLRPIQGVYYLVSGGGGGPSKAYEVSWDETSLYAATLGGFTYVRVTPTELVLEFVRMDGATQWGHALYKGRTGPH